MKKYLNFILRCFLLLFLSRQIVLVADCATDQCATQCAKSECTTDSKTFFRPRSIIEEPSLFLGLNQYNYYRQYFEPDMYSNCDDARIHIAKGIFYEQSRNKREHGLANYFFPLTSDASNTTADSSEAQLFESVLTLCPERKVVGGYLDYHQDFCFLDGLWFDVKFAIYQASHNLRPREKILSSNPSIDLTDICTPLCFLGSNQLNYGKVVNKKLTKSGFDDIEAKLGYYVFNNPECGYYLGLYGSLLVPISPKPTAEFLFEPLVGRGHWGLGIGLNGAASLHKSDNKSVTLLADVSYQYLFRGNEMRSLDFKVGPLSRFMSASTATNPAVSVPAINFTTMKLGVTPGSVVNLWTAVHLQNCRKHLEIGYNLWFRDAEKVCFRRQACSFNNLGIFNNDVFVPITEDNLDLASASHSRTLTNKIYVALSYDINWCLPINLGIGGSYEFSKKINAVEQWGIWGNCEVSF